MTAAFAFPKLRRVDGAFTRPSSPVTPRKRMVGGAAVDTTRRIVILAPATGRPVRDVAAFTTRGTVTSGH